MGFDEHQLLYRLRYTCFIHVLSCWHGVQRDDVDQRVLLSSYNTCYKPDTLVISELQKQLGEKNDLILRLKHHLNVLHAEHDADTAELRRHFAKDLAKAEEVKQQAIKAVQEESRVQIKFWMKRCEEKEDMYSAYEVSTDIAPECIFFNGLVTNKLCLKYDH